MKFAVAALLVGSAVAFAPASQPKVSSTVLEATRAVSSVKPKKAVAATKAVKKAPVAVKKAAPVAVKKAAPVAVKKAAPKPKPAVKKPAVKKAAPKALFSAKKPATEFAYGLPGSLPPVGNFDPLGLSEKADEATVRRYRECEIMHGRFAMLAWAGFYFPEKYAASGGWGEDYLAPTGKALDVFESTPNLAYLTLAVISLLETVRLLQTQPGTRADGKNEGIGWRPSDPEEYARYEVRELQNGRLAMLAFAGAVTQELITDQPLLVTLREAGYDGAIL